MNESKSIQNQELLDPTLKPENEQFPVFAFDPYFTIKEDEIITEFIPKYEIIEDENKNRFWKLDKDKNLIPKPLDSITEREYLESYADYLKFVDFKEDQNLTLILEQIEQERNEIIAEEPIEPETEKESTESFGDESLISDAFELKNTITTEWNEIVLGVKNGDWDHDMRLELEKSDYMNTKVYDRAWEVKDMIEKLLGGKHLSLTQVVCPANRSLGIKELDYRKIFVDMQTPENHGKNSCRLLVSMCRLMGKCVHKQITFEAVETIEPEITTSSGIREAW